MSDTPPKMTGVKPPPEPPHKQTKPKADTKPKQAPSGKPRGRPPELEKKLQDTFTMIGGTVAVLGDQWDGEHIMANSEAMAKAWGDLAQRNARVKAILESMLSSSQWAAVVATTAAVAVPIAMHHGLIPPLDIPGLASPPPSESMMAKAQQQAAQEAAGPTSPVTPAHNPQDM